MAGKLYEEYGHVKGTQFYTRKEAINRVKELLKNDNLLLNGRKINEISDDDLIEIGFNHFEFENI